MYNPKYYDMRRSIFETDFRSGFLFVDIDDDSDTNDSKVYSSFIRSFIKYFYKNLKTYFSKVLKKVSK